MIIVVFAFTSLMLWALVLAMIISGRMFWREDVISWRTGGEAFSSTCMVAVARGGIKVSSFSVEARRGGRISPQYQASDRDWKVYRRVEEPFRYSAFWSAQFLGFRVALPRELYETTDEPSQLGLGRWTASTPFQVPHQAIRTWSVVIPDWFLFLTAGIVPFRLAFWFRAWRRMHRRRRLGLCLQCGYDLTGNISGICSECGKPIPTRVTLT
jgi:hypothetical protein